MGWLVDTTQRVGQPSKSEAGEVGKAFFDDFGSHQTPSCL